MSDVVKAICGACALEGLTTFASIHLATDLTSEQRLRAERVAMTRLGNELGKGHHAGLHGVPRAEVQS